MRLSTAALLLILLTGCESDERKRCYGECDTVAKRADKCDGPGAAECKAGIMAIVEECRTACKELVE